MMGNKGFMYLGSGSSEDVEVSDKKTQAWQGIYEFLDTDECRCSQSNKNTMTIDFDYGWDAAIKQAKETMLEYARLMGDDYYREKTIKAIEERLGLEE